MSEPKNSIRFVFLVIENGSIPKISLFGGSLAEETKFSVNNAFLAGSLVALNKTLWSTLIFKVFCGKKDYTTVFDSEESESDGIF